MAKRTFENFMISKELIEEVKNRLVKTYNPVEIYLFGSYAWGSPDEESDLDLLVVVDKSDENPHKRGEIGADVLWDLKIPKDLLIYTKDEFMNRIVDPTTLCYKVQKEGRVLYARA
jgi:predicted nucleotidyltransferase